MTGFNKVMRFCNTLQDYESAKNQGTITDDLFVVILQDKLAKFKGQTFDWSQNADLTALATKGELEDLAEEIASNERVWAEALNDLNERINEIGTGGGGGGGGGTSDIVVDAALSTTSTNAIQNKAVANALNEKADASALASKQDTLVSGINIKTVQGQSILGEGNIKIPFLTVESSLSDTSMNPVQNKVVKAAIDELQQEDAKIETQLAELSALGQYETGGEYIRAYVDAEGKFLWGIKHDGSIEWAKGVPVPIKRYIEEIYKNDDAEIARINQLIAELSQDVGVIDNRTNVFSTEENPEYIEVLTDIEDKVIAYRDRNGVRYERKMLVSDSLTLGERAMSQLHKDLITSGFNTKSPIDWSNETTIKLPIPRYCAKVNIISATGLGVTKIDDKKCILEYWDKSGNYFRKYIILNAQGSSSMAYIEKNQGIDVFNDEACEESCDIVFDNWVAQDSFHLKCYYIDVFRGVANMGYNFAEQAIQFLDCRNNRIIKDNQSITAYDSTGDFDTDFGDGALCHPDGFPFEMYVNGEYYGLYAWNLKKHRKNYSMNKKDYTTALLDGEIGVNEFFGGNIDWTAFELRNPKDLVTMDGGEYDGENPSELIDSTSSAYDASNSTHVKTAQTKALLIRQSNAIAAIAAENNADAARNIFEQYYDKKAMACYFIISNVLYHYDGFWKNWIWTLYDKILAPSFYDLDSIFGRAWTGVKVEEASTTVVLGTDTRLPTGQLVRLYKSELDAMYKEMRDGNIVSVENIMHHVHDWMDRVGLDAYRNNIEKWPSIPSYRSEKNMNDGSYDGGFFDSAKRIELWLSERIAKLDTYFNY